MRYAILLSIALVLGGCSVGLSSKPFVDTKSFIDVGERVPLSIPVDAIDYYGCEVGRFICQSTGRLSNRLCWCETSTMY